MKLLILGNARHGKTQLAKRWRDMYGIKFQDSSMAAARIFLFDALKEKYGYKTIEECHADRVNHREERFYLISKYNKDDKAKLAKDILMDSDCYVGMRNRAEVYQCIKDGIFDLIVWVDATKRLEEEDKTSFDIQIDVADIVIENNGSLDEFKAKAIELGDKLF